MSIYNKEYVVVGRYGNVWIVPELNNFFINSQPYDNTTKHFIMPIKCVSNSFFYSNYTNFILV